jgi:hypothetical protein
MKALTVVLLAFVLFFSSCSKNSLSNSRSETSGHLKYGGDPNADGLGYYLITDSTHETLHLENLPAEYKHEDINVHVAVSFFDTGTTLTLEALPGTVGPRIVVIRSIRKL